MKDRQCTYERNILARSCNHCCRGKAVSIAYSESVFVTLVVQCAMRIRLIIFIFVASLAVSVFFSFWLQIQRSWVRSPALPDFLSSSGSGTGSTQPREVN